MLFASLLWLVLLSIQPFVAARECPSACTCTELAIACSNVTAVEFGKIFNEVGFEVVNRLIVTKCAEPVGRVDGFPKNFRARALEISGCGLTGFGADAFKFLTDDLVELRIQNNSLTSVPFLQNLKRLEFLNLNRNLVRLTALSSATLCF